MEANVIMCRCDKCSKVYGIRVERMPDGDWWRTWAFKISEKSAHREGFDRNVIRGNMFETADYPGCPYCGTHEFVQCGYCGRLNCWNHEPALYCSWCGKLMDNIIVARDKFDVSANQF